MGNFMWKLKSMVLVENISHSYSSFHYKDGKAAIKTGK